MIIPQRGLKLFLAGNTNKALCSAATLAVLNALDAINNFTIPKAKTKGSKSAMKEVTEM